MIILTPEAWTYYRAALESSSHMKLNKIMQWFTGNIGFHHIHHLNVRIPFLSPAGSDGRHTQTSVTDNNDIVASRHQRLF